MDGSITQLGLSNYLINKDIKSRASTKSFFEHSYKNYRNFATDSRRINFRGTQQFGSRCTCKIDEDARYGDLISNIYIEIDLPDISNIRDDNGGSIGYCDGVGNALVSNVDIRINSELIDSHPSIWRDIWSQLTFKSGQLTNYRAMIKKSADCVSFNVTSFQGGKVYVPLMFWFSQNMGVYDTTNWIFPLVAFANNTIELNVDFAELASIVVSDQNASISALSSISQSLECNLIMDFVILEEEDRVNYIERPRQLYVINQLQYQTYSIPSGTTSAVLSLKPFRYLISELIFVLQTTSAYNNNDYFNYSNTTNIFGRMSPFTTITLSFDGRDKCNNMDTTYFTQLIPSKAHENGEPNLFIHCYNFAIKPENVTQPTGLCNFSEIHEPTLKVGLIPNLPASTIWVFGLNYNVLQTNEDGGVWLLHSLSKRVPYNFPKDAPSVIVNS